MHFDLWSFVGGLMMGSACGWVLAAMVIADWKAEPPIDREKERREAAVKARAVAEFDEMRR